MNEDEIKKYHHFKIKTSDGIELDLIETKYYEELLDLYKQEKEKNKDNNEKIKYAARQIAALNRDNTKILAGKDKEEKLNYKYFDFKPIECQEYKSKNKRIRRTRRLV